MHIDVPHNTSKEIARRKIEARLGQLLAQFGGHADEMEHSWFGDTLSFKGKAKGMHVEGTVEVTDAAVVIDGKLPLIAKMFEGRIRHAVEREAEAMFS
jgi:hypothetical protein